MSKLRPAVVLAPAGRGDWILCQVTSKSYSDSLAVSITDEDFARGSLRLASYARPAKLFTANESLISTEAGTLMAATLTKVIDQVVSVIRGVTASGGQS